MKNQKGITLIALVITIIVLLILAAVSISMVIGDNGVVNKASTSKLETRGSSVEEARALWMNERFLAQKTGETPKSMEQILQELQDKELLTSEEVNIIKNNENNEITIGSRTISFKIEEDEKKDLTKVNIGDYVNYIPDIVTDEKKSEINGYIKKYSGKSDNNTVTQVLDLKWRVLDIDENGIITLISEGDTSNFYLYGPTGYNNGVKLLNSICDSFYSNETLNATSRNLNREDIEKYVDKTKFNSEIYMGDYYEPYTTNKYYPNIYPLENNYSTIAKNQIDGLDTTGTLLRSEQLEWIEGSYSAASTSIRPVGMGYLGKSNITETNHIFISDIYYELILKETSGFWLSTREFYPMGNSANYVCWCIGYASNDYVGGISLMDVHTGGSACKMIRPIVFIDSSVECDSGDGTLENPWNIKIN